MEGPTSTYRGVRRLHSPSPLLRFQSDERLIGYVRRGHVGAFEALVGRYEGRLFAFCRHLLGSPEDAEDVLQETLAAAFKAIVADERPIHVRPWLYRIARNRSLNHLRRAEAVTEEMDLHLSDNGATTADAVQKREDFRLLVDDIRTLPETQRTALVLREMQALSYEQIAATMDTTVPGVKSLLVRARGSLATAAEARHLSCEQVRVELCRTVRRTRAPPERPGPPTPPRLRAVQCLPFGAARDGWLRDPRLDRRGSPRVVAGSLTDREQRLEIVPRVRLERDHRVRPSHALELGEPTGHELGELLMLAHADDRDEVPLARDRVGLGHSLEIGELPAERGQRGPLRLDQDDRVYHGPSALSRVGLAGLEHDHVRAAWRTRRRT